MFNILIYYISLYRPSYGSTLHTQHTQKKKNETQSQIASSVEKHFSLCKKKPEL